MLIGGFIFGFLCGVISMPKISNLIYSIIYVDIEGDENNIDSIIDAFKHDENAYIRLIKGITPRIRVSKDLFSFCQNAESTEEKTRQIISYLKNITEKRTGLRIIADGKY